MKKTKLKFAAAVAALAMTFAMFTGCNPGEDATSSDTTGSTDSTSTTGSTDSDTSTDNSGNAASDDGIAGVDPVSETLYSFVVEKTSDSITTNNTYGQADLVLAGNDIAVSEGDWIICVADKISFNDSSTKSIGQCYPQVNLASGSKSFTIGQYWSTANTNKYIENQYWLYKITAADEGTIGSVQLAANYVDADAQYGVSNSASGTEIVLTNFYIVKIEKANVEKVAPYIIKDTSVTLTKGTYDSSKSFYPYSATLTTIADIPENGKLNISFTRSVTLSADWKTHYLNLKTESNNWFATYPQGSTTDISFVADGTAKVAKGAEIEIGLQYPDSLDEVAFNNITIQVLPKF